MVLVFSCQGSCAALEDLLLPMTGQEQTLLKMKVDI